MTEPPILGVVMATRNGATTSGNQLNARLDDWFRGSVVVGGE